MAVLVTLLAGSCINKTYYQPFSYVVNNIGYEYDKYDHWQTPNKTRKLKTGDCEDMAILLLDEWKKKGIEGRLVIGLWYGYSANAHAWCEVMYKGELYIADPTAGTFFPKSRKGIGTKTYIELEDKTGYIESKKQRLKRDIKRES